jgi:hypothetical protein
LREAWDENPYFEPLATDATLVDNASMRLSRSFRRSRSFLTLSGAGSGTRYHDISDLDRFSWSAGLSAAHRFTPRTFFSLFEDFNAAYSTSDELLAGSGVLLPLVRTWTSRGGAELSHDLNSRVSLAASVRYDRVDFEESTLVEGSELGLGARASRRLGATDSVDLIYVYQRSLVDQTTLPVHNVHLAWNGTHGNRYSFGLGAGLSYLDARGDADDVVEPFGFAAGTLRGRFGMLQAQYSRSVSQAFGLGRIRVANLVSVGASRDLTRWLTASGTYGYGHSRDVLDPDFLAESQAYEASLRFALARTLRLVATYGWRQSETTGSLEASGAIASVSLLYEKGF